MAIGDIDQFINDMDDPLVDVHIRENKKKSIPVIFSQQLILIHEQWLVLDPDI